MDSPPPHKIFLSGYNIISYHYKTIDYKIKINFLNTTNATRNIFLNVSTIENSFQNRIRNVFENTLSVLAKRRATAYCNVAS